MIVSEKKEIFYHNIVQTLTLYERAHIIINNKNVFVKRGWQESHGCPRQSLCGNRSGNP